MYIGVTSNLIKRIEEHKNDKGSIFTKKYNANELVYYEIFSDINFVIQREKQLMHWNREWKWNLVKEKGKPERVIKVALANKLLKQAFAIATSKQKYNENYQLNSCI